MLGTGDSPLVELEILSENGTRSLPVPRFIFSFCIEIKYLRKVDFDALTNKLARSGGVIL